VKYFRSVATNAAQAGKHSRLGRYFSKYDISATISLPITDEVSAHVCPDLRDVLFGPEFDTWMQTGHMDIAKQALLS
jgi:hypothetical protein